MLICLRLQPVIDDSAASGCHDDAERKCLTAGARRPREEEDDEDGESVDKCIRQYNRINLE